MIRRIALPILLGLITAACSGTIMMSPLDPGDIEKNYGVKNADGTFDRKDTVGIIVYRAIPVVEVDRLTQANVKEDPDKPPVVSDTCKPVLTRKLISVADAQHPYRLHYEHGILEAYTFGATLTSDGILTVINTVSVPDQGKTVQNLVSAAVSAAGTFRLMEDKLKGKPDCTMTPVFFGYEQPPKWDSLEEFNTLNLVQPKESETSKR